MAASDRDVLITPSAGSAGSASPARVVAFIPIAVALFGVGLILFGGVRANDTAAGLGAAAAVDPVVTGTVLTPRDHRHDLEMLDR